jgi:hypothetical protein
LLATALMPALAQAPAAPTGKVHGHVTNPTGEVQGSGNVSLSTDGSRLPPMATSPVMQLPEPT